MSHQTQWEARGDDFGRSLSQASEQWEALARAVRSDVPIDVRSGSWRTARELCAAALCVALALGASSFLGSCSKHQDTTPELSGPCPPPTPLVLRAVAYDQAGHLVGIYGELVR